MYNLLDITQRIKNTAKHKGIQQIELLRACGLSKNYINQIPLNKDLQIGNIMLIARQLGVSADWILYGDNLPDKDLTDRERLKLNIDLLSDDEFEKLNQIAQVMLPEKFSTQKDDPQK